MSKANFDHIYTAPDPRPYFQTLDGLDYQIPAHGASLFSAVAEHVAEVRDRDTVRIADLCCSYGINAAVMKHEPTFDEIVAHYTTDDCQALDRDDLLARDRAFFEERRDGSASKSSASTCRQRPSGTPSRPGSSMVARPRISRRGTRPPS
jgi:hypothetical protein